MAKQGVVLMNDEEIGIFEVNHSGVMTFEFYRGGGDIVEQLEYAGDQGFTISLMFKPAYDAKD